jgi:hypothetical protein
MRYQFRTKQQAAGETRQVGSIRLKSCRRLVAEASARNHTTGCCAGAAPVLAPVDRAELAP